MQTGNVHICLHMHAHSAVGSSPFKLKAQVDLYGSPEHSGEFANPLSVDIPLEKLVEDTRMAEQQLQNMQAQIQVLLNQVTLLSQTTDQQAQKIESMKDYEAMKQEIIRLRNVVGDGGTTNNNDNDNNNNNNKYLVNVKDVKIENFGGDTEKFADFLEDTKTYTDVIMPELGELMEWL